MSETKQLWIVDDDAAFRERLAKAFRRRGYATEVADGADSLAQLLDRGAPDFAIVDLRIRRGSGLALIPAIHQHNRQARILVLTGYGNIATAVEAVRLGAVDYLTKPASVEQIEQALLGRKTEQAVPPQAWPSLEQVEWEHLHRVLHDCRDNISQAARILGIERRTLQRKLQKYAPTAPPPQG